MMAMGDKVLQFKGASAKANFTQSPHPSRFTTSGEYCRIALEEVLAVLIKSADDKVKRLRLLEELHASDRLNAFQRDWLVKELRNTKQGMAGEKSAAHYLDNYLGGSKNNMVIHDLRISVDGEVAQIDHLIVGRMDFYLLETKTFGGDLHINEFGEFSVEYPGQRVYGIPSPLEQSARHGNVLSKMLERLEIRPRIGSKFGFQHLVLVDPRQSIRRPEPKQFDTSMVIKADQFPGWHKKYLEDDTGIGSALQMLAVVRSQQTVKDWAEKIARQHRPKNLLELPDFMTPTEKPSTTPDGRFKTPAHATAKKLVCATCGTKISYPEGKFCWNNERRFGGLQYCRAHQAAFA
jgi:hypothetical protein